MDSELGIICPNCFAWGHDARCTACGTIKVQSEQVKEEPVIQKPRREIKKPEVKKSTPGAIKPITLMRERLKFLDSEMKRLKSYEAEYSQLKAAIAAISIPRKKREGI